MFKKTESTNSKKLLSDHMPFLIKSDVAAFLCWNMLCQMSFNDKWNYFNNGFACSKENDSQYTHRLNRSALKISNYVKENKVSFVCLQECPETEFFQTQLTNALRENLDNYNICQYNNTQDEYFLTTLYNDDYEVETELTKKVQALPLKEGLAQRVLPMVFLNKQFKNSILVVNVHANFGRDVAQDISLLTEFKKINDINEIILMGDFNRDLVLKSDDYSKHDIADALDENSKFSNLYVHAIPASSFIAKYNGEENITNVVLETRDGVLSTIPVELECLTSLNTIQRNEISGKDLSDSLSNIPNYFIENLNKFNDSAKNSVTAGTPMGFV